MENEAEVLLSERQIEREKESERARERKRAEYGQMKN